MLKSGMNKLLSLVLVFIMLFSLFACGEYIDPTGGGSGSGSGNIDDTTDDDPVLNDDPSDDFTVTVMVNGAPYSPRMDMDVYWKDGTSVHKAPLNKQGVARIDGLDGDYRISLSAVPNEYTYDPNGTIATNDDRNVVLNLYPLNILTGGGTGIYDCYKFTDTGVYSAVIAKPGDAIFFEYAPKEEGVYTIESWIDTALDTINPYVDVYYGSTQWKSFEKTTDDGGPVGSYTINFVHQIQILSEQISAGGQAVYTFAVKAESKFNQYPITVTFAVKHNNEIKPTPIDPTQSYGYAVPELDFSTYNVSDHEYENAEIKYPEYVFDGKANTVVFDQKLVKLWKKSAGGDDFYHIYDEEKYASTGGYGPILYANITSSCRFIDRAFSNIEYRGDEIINNALSVGGYNYKHFIEGYTSLSTYLEKMNSSYYCSGDCTCHDASVSTTGWACAESCTNCAPNCRKCPDELIGNEGYQSIANSDGGVAVTEELKQFLYNYANSPRAQLFRDGAGYIDSTTWNGIYYQAPTGSEWLFACYYYE